MCSRSSSSGIQVFEPQVAAFLVCGDLCLGWGWGFQAPHQDLMSGEKFSPKWKVSYPTPGISVLCTSDSPWDLRLSKPSAQASMSVLDTSAPQYLRSRIGFQRPWGCVYTARIRSQHRQRNKEETKFIPESAERLRAPASRPTVPHEHAGCLTLELSSRLPRRRWTDLFPQLGCI